MTEALVTAQRYGHSGICVRENGRVVGIVARRDLDKAIRHGLGHAPVKGVMTRNITFARPSTGVDELRRIMVEGNIGRVPGSRRRGLRRSRRRRAARPWATWSASPPAPTCWRRIRGAGSRSRPCRLRLRSTPWRRWPTTRSSDGCSKACSALSEDFAGVYLVGGFVRDLLLEQPNVDVDIAVEGDGIEFATRLAAQLGGRVRAHRKFKTAVVLLPPEVLGEAPAWLRETERALPRRRGHHPHRVLRLPGGAAPGGARLHPPGPLPARLHHQRHGHLASGARLRHGHRLLRRLPRPARRRDHGCCTT